MRCIHQKQIAQQAVPAEEEQADELRMLHGAHFIESVGAVESALESPRPWAAVSGEFPE